MSVFIILRAVEPDGRKAARMWDQYRRTFTKTQAVIAMVTVASYFYMGRFAARSALFFVVMQLAAFVGAAWGVRLKRKVDRKAW
ncbi:MAG TPA: hypothetical protein VHK47_24395 [Polyangia bacterium]|nr:hypothetical protein [Polyangia bacterium]